MDKSLEVAEMVASPSMAWRALVIGLLITACSSAATPTPSQTLPPLDPLPTIAATPRPTATPGPRPITAIGIAAGSRHTCALMDDGAAMCWGSNESGQLGNGTTSDSSLPVGVAGLGSGVIAIAAGGAHTCALVDGGGVKCWGSNGGGQLGDGSTVGSSVPVEVSGLDHGVTAVAAGGWHTCAVTTGGGVTCWGYNYYQQLGTGGATDSTVPVPVSGLASGVIAVATGDIHSCALTTSGGVKCWGYAGSGGLGGGAPGDVPSLAGGVVSIAASNEQTCALTTDGAVLCWRGFDGSGPLAVPGLGSRISAISAGLGQTCALTTDGTVTCWGSNGNAPIDVAGLADGAAAIAVGGGHACALTSAGVVTCWGDNWEGQLGNGRTCGTLSRSSTPVDVEFGPPSTSEPTLMPVGPIQHATGPTDVVLRIDYGPDLGVGELEGEFFQPGPEFTLYGDGTVIFRDDPANPPPAEDTIVRAAPFMIAELDDDRVQSLLRLALGEGGLADACEVYPTQDIDGFGGPVFTIHAGGLDKRVEVNGPSPLGPLTEQLSGLASEAGVSTQIWVPDRYWGNLFDAASAIEIGLLPDPREAGSAPWPWPGISPDDFSGLEDGGWGSGRRVMSPAEAAVLGLSDNGGVVGRTYLIGPDGTTVYSFSLWPMLPDEAG
jgi:alpha-tubulin suppressor-like RCC1 family protein